MVANHSKNGVLLLLFKAVQFSKVTFVDLKKSLSIWMFFDGGKFMLLLFMNLHYSWTHTSSTP